VNSKFTIKIQCRLVKLPYDAALQGFKTLKGLAKRH